MIVLKNLMEVYSDYIGLPILLVNLDGKIDFKVDVNNCILPKHEDISNLLELKAIALQIDNPTIMSVADESISSGTFYIITPIFKIEGVDRFLAAGPFLIEALNEVKVNPTRKTILTVFQDEEIETGISKIRKLHHILTKKVSAETKFSIPKTIINVLQSLGDLDYEILDYDTFICDVFEELLEIEALDFLGLAIKNSDDVFVIENITGENMQHLAEKRFYMGEGMLGMAAISGTDLSWSKATDSPSAEFFNRHGIFPNHLLGIPFEQEGKVTSMVIGGNFKEKSISEELFYLLKCIIRLYTQRKNMHVKVADSIYNQAIFRHWLDLMDVILHKQESKYVPGEILELCQILNHGKFSCFTSTQGEFSYKGTMNQSILINHNSSIVEDTFIRPANIWIKSNCIYLHVQHYGLFTAEFGEETDLQYAFYILGMVDKLLQHNRISPKQSVLLKNESIFELLQTSMQEMNSRKYQVSSLAVNMVNNLTEIIQIDDAQKEMLRNICSVLPYELDYLKKHISHTTEWALLEKVRLMIEDKEMLEVSNIEMKMLVFIYKVIIKGEPKERIDFLTTDLSELFMSAYEASLKVIKHHKVQSKIEIGREQIEEMTDLKSIISTLALTAREKEILYLILEGLNNQEVGEYLKISVHTVKNHVTNIFKKLNVSDRIHAMAKIYRIKYGET